MFTVRKLGLIHSFELLEVQEKGARPEHFTFRGLKSIIKALLNDRCVGVFDNGKLIAYSIFAQAGSGDVTQADLSMKKVGKFSGTVVLPEYRGKGIQKKLLRSHVAYAKSKKFDAIMAYVHKDNGASISNIRGSGLSFLKNTYIKDKSDYRDIYLKEFLN